jgi:hypothetical protein
VTFGIESLVDLRGIFFLAACRSDLAPKKKPTKFQLEMATSIDDLKMTMETMATQLAGVQDMVNQFAGFQQMMTTTLDKLNELEAWRTVAETAAVGSAATATTNSTATTCVPAVASAHPAPL